MNKSKLTLDTHRKSEDEVIERPSPLDFIRFVPYACRQLQLDVTVVVNKAYQYEIVGSISTERSKKVRSRSNQSKYNLGSNQDNDESLDGLPTQTDTNVVRITAICDTSNNLLEIRFEKNRYIPQTLLKVIGLIVHFYKYLNRIVINTGLDKYIIYEINTFLNDSNVTEICLDNCVIKEANYYILLETAKNLRHLSLSRCRINDRVVDMISKRLTYPLLASNVLIVLNLSTNRITDVGANYLAEALRSNRKLSYLNLADNRLTDEGACIILDSLKDFSLTYDEILTSRSRHFQFLKTKESLIQKIIKELRVGELDKKPVIKRKLTKTATPVSARRGKLEKESSMKSLGDTFGKSLMNIDSIVYCKAMTMAENELGEFNDPFSSKNTVVKEGVIYCQGNNTLMYLSIAYNNLTYLTIKRLLNVLEYQKKMDRLPRGLINVKIDGNFLPNSCEELVKIDDILDKGLSFSNKGSSTIKKKSGPKSIR